MTPSDVPPPPRGLSPRSRKLWRDVTARYLMSPAELALFEGGLKLLDRADEARAIVDAEGLTVVDRYGSPRGHPLIDLEVRCRSAYAQTVRQLGVKSTAAELSPARRKPRLTAVAPLRSLPGRPPLGA